MRREPVLVSATALGVSSTSIVPESTLMFPVTRGKPVSRLISPAAISYPLSSYAEEPHGIGARVGVVHPERTFQRVRCAVVGVDNALNRVRTILIRHSREQNVRAAVEDSKRLRCITHLCRPTTDGPISESANDPSANIPGGHLSSSPYEIPVSLPKAARRFVPMFPWNRICST